MDIKQASLSHAPVVTVLVPFYNGAGHIRETLQSIKSQTFENFKCIVLDDGSEQAHVANLEEIISSLDDARFSFVSKSNVGLCGNINRALSDISTPYIARVDQDDLCLPHRLETQVLCLTTRNSDCCFGGIVKFGRQRQTQYKSRFQSDTVPYCPISIGGVVHSTMLIKTECLRELGGYDAQFYPSDDWDLTLRMIQANLKVDYIDDALIKYRFHDSANTYRFYARMCETRRRSEANFPSIFREGAKNEGRLLSTIDNYYAPVRRFLKDKSKLCFRRAGGCYLDGRTIAAFGWMLMSFIWHPRRYFVRVAQLIKVKQ